MATKTVVTDDIDGSADATTIGFAYDGKSYEIDLTAKNRRAMEKALKPYIDAARPAAETATSRTRTPKRSTRRAAGSSGVNLADVRTWAADNGYEVSARGRVAEEVLTAYQAAH